MKTFQSQSQPAQRAAASSLHSLGSSAVSPLSTAGITVAALLILTIPVCKSAPAELQQATTDQRKLLSQIDAVCSSYLSADLKFWASDVLGELCVLTLVQKSKELKVRENSKRFLFHYSRPQGSVLSQGPTPLLHPLLHLVSQLYARRERGHSMHAELQGPAGIQSRGYFLYRPRNGRRSLEYE
ncbi:neuromedin-U isoform X1 [Siniperca chuatsi]|uniref:neuromedin-U isoform X1 n=1 Tax=Siniperca chuatsi TaxID=119488 RepID=UPI001CE09317|nr:neuromedin-U isoform X1 [Siniperca chuatsi]XP_044054696.1 neuromedin-U isoform X1 [Siniperca chuatsi]XP_044054697.1 neuromedin-U isoform X1 [Siniperca chuatsi]XP_044054698.1 neuromedin-U isoform X1 [Siniperca chuatsi]